MGRLFASSEKCCSATFRPTMHCKRHALVLPLAGLLVTAAASSLGAQGLRAYGQGTAGSPKAGGKVPFIWATSTPRPGNAGFGITIDRGRPNALSMMFLSLNTADFTVGGVRVLIDFGASLQFPLAKLDGAGSLTYHLPIPNVAALVDARVHHQAFIADSGAAPLGFSATQGLDVRVMRSGMLLATRSTGGLSPPQIAINLDNGKRSSFSHSGMTNNFIPGLLPRTRTHMLVGCSRRDKVVLFDCTVFPPKFNLEFSSSGHPHGCTWSPDGVRAYIVNQTMSTGKPEVQIVWALLGKPNFGSPFPGGNIPLGKTIDALRMLFPKDGNTGILGVLGLFGGGGELRKYDTRPGSPTYNTSLGLYKVAGKILWDFCRVDENTVACGLSGLGGRGVIHLVDIRTMKLVKAFSGKFGPVIQGIVADARGRYLYIGNTPKGAIPPGTIRINIDKTDANYGKIVNIGAGLQPTWSVWDVEVSDAGDRLYALAGEGIQTAFVGNILEYDTTTLKVLRTWSMKGLGNTYNFAIR